MLTGRNGMMMYMLSLEVFGSGEDRF